MDPQTEHDAAEQSPPPADQAEPEVEEREDAASPPSREPKSNGVMNRFLRGLGFGPKDEGPSDDETPEQEAPTPASRGSQPAPQQEPERLSLTQDEFRRAVQAAKDRELVAERRSSAAQQADAGDLTPIRELARKGDRWAAHQLAERGDTWELGEQAQQQLLAERQRAEDPLPAIAQSFDQAVIWPLLAALPEAEEKRIVGTGIVGMAGRQKAVEDALGVHAREAVTKALADEQFATALLKSETFRAALFKHPAVAKRLLTMGRDDREEGDLLPATGRASRRENDWFNDVIRGGPVPRDDE